MPRPKPRKKIGLALGGGAARGIAHIGVIRALEQNDIPIDYIVGCSCGSLIGGLYASGLDIDYMISHVGHLRWFDIAGFHLSKRGMVSSRPLERFVERHVGDIRIKALKIPFVAMATDILSGEAVQMNKPDTKLAVAVRASTSFPGVYAPCKYKDRLLIDGGAANNLPVEVTYEQGADVVIAVDVIPTTTLDLLPPNIPTLIDRGLDLLLHRSAAASGKKADVLLKPIKENINSFDIKKADRLIYLGQEAVYDALPKIKKAIK